MANTAIRPVDVAITQDWTKLIALFDSLRTRWQNNQLENGVLIPESGDCRYYFGNTGCFTTLDCVTGHAQDSALLSGAIVDSQLPWIKQLEQDFAPLKIFNFDISGMTGSFTPHVDRKPGHDGAHCRINYMLNNTAAVTYAQGLDGVESYPGRVHTAWLLDTTKTHWVDNSQSRYIFQINFHESYDTVSHWLDQHPGLMYGS